MSTTATYEIEGMTCGHCVAAVTNELDGLPGVEHVEVSLEAGTAVVTGAVEDAAVRQAVEEAGYTVRPRR